MFEIIFPVHSGLLRIISSFNRLCVPARHCPVFRPALDLTPHDGHQSGGYSHPIISINRKRKNMRSSLVRTLLTQRRRRGYSILSGAHWITMRTSMSFILTARLKVCDTSIGSSIPRGGYSLSLGDVLDVVNGHLLASGIPHWTLFYTSCYYSVRSFN